MSSESMSRWGHTSPRQRESDDWVDTDFFEQARAWADSDPQTSQKVVAVALRYANHRLAMEWFDRVVVFLLSIGLLSVAWHFADIGAPLTGLAILGSGALISGATAIGIRKVSAPAGRPQKPRRARR